MSGRRIALMAVLVVAGAAVVVAAVIVGSGEDRPPPGPGAKLYEGIPQDGDFLGDPKAPVLLEEYADLQCPFCRAYADKVLPALVEEYVRPGRVRMRLRLTTYLGPDSERGARVALAAGLQDKLWQFADDWYRTQGPENSGYASEDYLRERVEGAGLDPDDVLAKRTDPQIARQLASVERAVERYRIQGTPWFRVGPAAGTLRRLRVPTEDLDAYRKALDEALRTAR